MLTRIGLISLCLVTFASGCASRTTPVQLVPDQELLADCPRTAVRLETNGDLAIAYRTRDQDLSRCNADKAALRAFFATRAE